MLGAKAAIVRAGFTQASLTGGASTIAGGDLAGSGASGRVLGEATRVGG